MATIDVGRVVPVLRGNYSAQIKYEINDIVIYNKATYWHHSKNETTNVPPTDEETWTKIVDDSKSEEYAEDAKTHAESAESSANSAANAANAAEGSANSAATAATAANNSAQAAATSATQAAKVVNFSLKIDNEGHVYIDDGGN